MKKEKNKTPRFNPRSLYFKKGMNIFCCKAMEKKEEKTKKYSKVHK